VLHYSIGQGIGNKSKFPQNIAHLNKHGNYLGVDCLFGGIGSSFFARKDRVEFFLKELAWISFTLY
jgi:hypothetical protein